MKLSTENVLDTSKLNVVTIFWELEHTHLYALAGNTYTNKIPHDIPETVGGTKKKKRKRCNTEYFDKHHHLPPSLYAL